MKKPSANSSELCVPLYAIEEGEDASKKRKMNIAIGATKTLAQAFENMGRAEMDRKNGSSGSSKYWDVNMDVNI
ncbi:hypothetical protein EJ110_NYTH34669 [Nymphaea thermarum]|nr:hypothetical protein EJ110_NYTH34669 [Nymphaea thermarum]